MGMVWEILTHRLPILNPVNDMAKSKAATSRKQLQTPMRTTKGMAKSQGKASPVNKVAAKNRKLLMELLMRKVLMETHHLRSIIIKRQNSPEIPTKRSMRTIGSQKLRW